MKIKTNEATGKALDYLVGVAEGCKVEYWHSKSVAILFPGAPRAVPWSPSNNWSQGGPIIEREKLSIEDIQGAWKSELEYLSATDADYRYGLGFGQTPLIAAMRCYVASKLGGEVEIPQELI